MKSCLDCDRPCRGTRCAPCRAAYLRTYEARRSRRKARMRNKRLAGGTGAQARLRAHIRALEARGISVPCARCKAVNVELDVDHITPLWLGGEDVDENVQALCRHTCHRYKTAYEAELRKRVGARLFQVGPDPWRNSSEGPDAA